MQYVFEDGSTIDFQNEWNQEEKKAQEKEKAEEKENPLRSTLSLPKQQPRKKQDPASDLRTLSRLPGRARRPAPLDFAARDAPARRPRLRVHHRGRAAVDVTDTKRQTHWHGGAAHRSRPGKGRPGLQRRGGDDARASTHLPIDAPPHRRRRRKGREGRARRRERPSGFPGRRCRPSGLLGGGRRGCEQAGKERGAGQEGDVTGGRRR